MADRFPELSDSDSNKKTTWLSQNIVICQCLADWLLLLLFIMAFGFGK